MGEKMLILGLEAHFEKLSERLGQLKVPLHAYLAGGIAVNYHTGHRMSDDVDVKWSHRVAIPPDMQLFEAADPADPNDVRVITVDSGFSDVLGSFPPDWEKRSPLIAEVGDIRIHVMDPVDLAVSKVSRFQDRDRDDIRELAAQGLIDIEKFSERMEEALEFYVGDTTFIRYNLQDALEVIREQLNGPGP